MAASTVIAAPDSPREPIAPGWHTVLVLAPILLGSVASWYQNGLPNAHLPDMSSKLSGYLTVIVEEWFVVLLIWLALRRRGLSFGTLVSGRWQTAGAFFKDLGLGFGFMVVAIPLVGVLARLIGGDVGSTVARVVPKTGAELAVFLALTATAAFAEELIFRGYLIRQFYAWTGSRGFAVLLQGVFFGLAHGFYRSHMLAIMVEGCLLGVLVTWRKSLRPAMLAHGLQDTLGGILAFFS
jgi:CAAX protease family protein